MQFKRSLNVRQSAHDGGHAGFDLPCASAERLRFFRGTRVADPARMRWLALAMMVFACDGTLAEEGTDGDEAQAALSTNCSAPRRVVCPDSPFDCSYAAAECD